MMYNTQDKVFPFHTPFETKFLLYIPQKTVHGQFENSPPQHQQERDTFTDLRRGLGCNHNFLTYPWTMMYSTQDKVFPFHTFLRQSFCFVTPLLRQSFCFAHPKNCTWAVCKQSPPTPTRTTTLSSPWSVGCAADKNSPPPPPFFLPALLNHLLG